MTTGTPSAWADVLDRLANQVDRQESALRRGHAPPLDLEIDPPTDPMSPADRQRAIVLFERCEHLLDLATDRIVAGRRHGVSAYRSRS